MKLVYTLLAVITLVLVSPQTFAEHRGPGPCTDRAEAARVLGEQWGEKMVAEKDGKRLYVNPNTGSWSLVSWDDKTDTVCLLKEGEKEDMPKL